MSEWKEYKFSDLMEIIGGGTPKTTVPEYWGGNIPWLSIQDFNNGKKYCFDAEKKITEKGLKESSTKILKKGQIIISARGTVGVISMLGRDMAFNQSNYGLDAKRELTDNNFLYYLLKHNIGNFISNSYGAVFDTITKETFEQILVSIPELPEQQSIASILSSLDDKIDLLHCQNKTLEALAETLFRQWFVEEADESWEVGKLGDVINIFDSKRIPLSSMERDKMKFGNLYPYYGAATIMDYINDYLFDGEYILMGEDGTVETEGGYPVLQMPTGKFWVNNHAHIFIAQPPYSNYFIYTFLKLTSISNIVTGAVQPKINQEMLKSISFPIPDEVKTNKYVSMTNYYWDKMKSNNNQIRTLTQLRDTLLPKLMSGEVRVKN